MGYTLSMKRIVAGCELETCESSIMAYMVMVSRNRRVVLYAY